MVVKLSIFGNFGGNVWGKGLAFYWKWNFFDGVIFQRGMSGRYTGELSGVGVTNPMQDYKISMCSSYDGATLVNTHTDRQ